jgi:hypothetical protein
MFLVDSIFDVIAEKIQEAIMPISTTESRTRTWRIFTFGGIGVLYLLSLAVPSLRHTLAQMFAYFPR